MSLPPGSYVLSPQLLKPLFRWLTFTNRAFDEVLLIAHANFR